MAKRKNTWERQQTALQKEIDRIDAGGDAWVGSEEVVDIEFKQPLNVVIPVRLTQEKWHEVHREAKELGIGPSTLLRMWTLEKLRSVKRRRSRPA